MRLSKRLPGKQLGVTTASCSVVLIYLPTLRIPRALGCNTYSSLWLSFMLSVSAVFVPFLPYPLLSTVYQCDGCPSPQWCGGLWLAGQVLPANLVQSPPWSWLPIVEAPGCLRHPTLAEQHSCLIIIIIIIIL